MSKHAFPPPHVCRKFPQNSWSRTEGKKPGTQAMKCHWDVFYCFIRSGYIILSCLYFLRPNTWKRVEDWLLQLVFGSCHLFLMCHVFLLKILVIYYKRSMKFTIWDIFLTYLIGVREFFKYKRMNLYRKTFEL